MSDAALPVVGLLDDGPTVAAPAADLHAEPPMTLGQLAARVDWLLPATAIAFTVLAIAAAFESVPGDHILTRAAIDARTPATITAARAVSRLGSTPVVLTVAAVAAGLSWRRCRPLAAAIVVLALARPLVEFGYKELIGRERPAGDRLVRGRGPSFPSGHPFATAASWGFLPLVVALYTPRRTVWWCVAVGVWTLAVLVAASRVWLGVHWVSDVAGGLLLAVLGVAGSERFIALTHRGRRCAPDHTAPMV
jgi:undecaprenyl-diphosphatase